MKRILPVLVAITASACSLAAGIKTLNHPCGWCTCASLDGGHYNMKGGKGKTVTLTGGCGDSREALEQAIMQNNIIILDGSKGPFIVSKTISSTLRNPMSY